MNISKMKFVSIALVMFLLVCLMSGCFKLFPIPTPNDKQEEKSEVAKEVETTTKETPIPQPPPPPPEPDPIPGKVLPASWNESKIIEFRSQFIFDGNPEWRRKDDGDGVIYYFNQDSDFPRFSIYEDYVFDIKDFDEFFDWWLEERFFNPQYNPGVEVIRQEYVTYGGFKGLEIEYIDNSDGEANATLKHGFYVFHERNYFQIRFTFEPNGEAQYRDVVEYVFNSIRQINIEIDGWPTAYIPDNTPIYTDGDIGEGYAFAGERYSSVSVNIKNTSLEALTIFIKQMEKLGWTIENYDDKTGSGGLVKDSWYMNVYMDDSSTVTIGFNMNLD